jgi:sortase (surface protein transpeptidase)
MPFRTIPALALLLLLMSGGVALAARERNTGGSSLAVTIDAARRTTDGLTRVSGTARLGAPVESQPRTVIYVLDLSSSTNSGAGGDCGPDQDASDPESEPDEIVDCQIAAAKRLNAGLGKTAHAVAVIGFSGDAVSADLHPGDPWETFARPAQDADGDGVPDVERVLNSLRVPENADHDGGFFAFEPSRLQDPSTTNFSAAIERALTVARVAPSRDVTVLMLSDGQPTGGGSVEDALRGVRGVTFHTFAVGAGSACTKGAGGYGSLLEIARRTGGNCTRVRATADLPRTLSQFAGTTLTGLTVAADTRHARPVNRSGLSRTLPARGPATVRFDDDVEHVRRRVCVTARAAGTGGAGALTTCARVPLGAVAAGGRARGTRTAYEHPTGRLTVPSIGVGAAVRPLALRRDRTLAVPQDATSVGSYTATGGPLVLVGHVDWNGRPGVFSRLRELERGDRVRLVGHDGKVRRYLVTRLESHAKSRFPTRRVYGGPPSALRLITCGGAYDPHRRTYARNLIVYASEVTS